MIFGFIFWTLISFLFLGIGIWAWSSKKAVGFFSGVKPPAVSNIRKYNHSVAILWFAYALLFELLGLPFLFLKQNSAGFLLSVLGVPLISIVLMIVYTRILHRYELKKGGEQIGNHSS